MSAAADNLDQPEFFPAFVDPVIGEHATIQEKFEAFQAANPWVLQSYLKLLERARGRGFKRIGINFLTELLRWEFSGTTRDANSTFKINNNYAPRYARLIVQLHPEHTGFITMRTLTAP